MKKRSKTQLLKEMKEIEKDYWLTSITEKNIINKIEKSLYITHSHLINELREIKLRLVDIASEMEPLNYELYLLHRL